jgi:addiction module HigA family antidote
MRERKRPPVHPGRMLRNHDLNPLSLSVTDLANIQYSGYIQEDGLQDHKREGCLTPDMALRLARALNTTPNLWLGLQQEYGLWQAMHASKEWRHVHPVRES